MLEQVSECQNLIINIISYRLSSVFLSKDLKLQINFLYETSSETTGGVGGARVAIFSSKQNKQELTGYCKVMGKYQ